jgi:7,8-dihydroneopterin aldolase/epimerase/oxygenase
MLSFLYVFCESYSNWYRFPIIAFGNDQNRLIPLKEVDPDFSFYLLLNFFRKIFFLNFPPHTLRFGIMDKIRLTNIIFYAHHGFYKAERELGQKFEIDIEVGCDLKASALSDDLSKTIDYSKIYTIAKETFEHYKFKLLEAVAQKMADEILKQSGVIMVLIKVRKPHVPMNGLLDYVEVEIERSRD